MNDNTESKRILKRSAGYSVFLMILLLLVVSGATYAWFTFSPFTNVTPMAGTIGEGGIDLRISNNQNGPFAANCEILIDGDAELLKPVSTADLDTFYVPEGQGEDGVPKSYREIEKPEDYMMSGTLYLLSEGSDCRVSFSASRMDFGDDIQALASMRLGIIIKGNTYIFALDDMANTASATSRKTVPQSGTVYGGSYKNDPAVSLRSYMASGTGSDLTFPGNALCTIKADEVTPVRFFLYLEGCDDNCFNDVQAKDVAIQLGFAGFETE